MTNTQAVLAAIARHREALAKATKRPWATLEDRGINDLWADEDYVFDPQGEARGKKAQKNLAEAALAVNSHDALVDVWEAAVKVRANLYAQDLSDEACIELDALDAAMARLEEVSRG